MQKGIILDEAIIVSKRSFLEQRSDRLVVNVASNSLLHFKIKMESGDFYMTKYLEEFLVVDDISGFNVGLSKTLFHDLRRISVTFNDIFYKQNSTASIDFHDVRVSFFQREFSRNIRVNFSYQFGNTKMKNERK